MTQPGRQHPQEYREDLNPERLAGENSPEARRLTEFERAVDLKEAHEHPRLHGFSNEELARILVVAEGNRLEQGATYLDIAQSDSEPFTATGDMEAGRDNWFVPKSETDYQLWNRLTGVTDPERTGGE